MTSSPSSAPSATPPVAAPVPSFSGPPAYAPPRLPGTTPSSRPPVSAAAVPAPSVPASASPPAPGLGVATGVVSASAMAALPFTLDLPRDFVLIRGRPGGDFDVYSVQRGGRSFVMIYAGPASQFPIYQGETARLGDRTSVIVVEEGRRRALEHLFERGTAPREIHVWVASLAGAESEVAERIAQSVDAR